MSKDLGTGSTSELLKWATPVENRSVNKPASSDTPYQANMAFVMNKNVNQDKWYKGDSPTSYEIYGRIGSIYQTDPARASQLYSDFNTLQNTPGSKYYWPYGNPTNSAVAEMAGYGYDTSKLDDDWFNTNVGLRDYYTFSGSTNTPSKPGAKASQHGGKRLQDRLGGHHGNLAGAARGCGGLGGHADVAVVGKHDDRVGIGRLDSGEDVGGGHGAAGMPGTGRCHHADNVPAHLRCNFLKLFFCHICQS